MECRSCGAPLPPKSGRCRFCGTLNDVDLRRIASRDKGPSERDCPRCRKSMTVVAVGVGAGFEVERCPKCHGIFFDPGELEAVLGDAEKGVYEPDHGRLEVLLAEEAPELRFQEGMSYDPCPVCGALMNRKNFGARSGVVVDRCRDHGVWLDGGELRRLVQWARAGGRIHHERQQEARRATERRSREGAGAVPVPSTGRASTRLELPEAPPLLDDSWELVVDGLRAVLRWLR